ncbi:MAG: DUF805 domain-containing protein, partial [Amnibacterium sp.]
MRFEQAIRSGFRNYAEFGGRASRPEFWWWILFTTIVSAALNALPVWPFASMSGLHLADGTTVPIAVPGTGG